MARATASSPTACSTRSPTRSRRAACYLLGVAENEPDEIVAWLGERGFTATTVGERRAQNERLFVIRFARGCDDSRSTPDIVDATESGSTHAATQHAARTQPVTLQITGRPLKV